MDMISFFCENAELVDTELRETGFLTGCSSQWDSYPYDNSGWLLSRQLEIYLCRAVVIGHLEAITYLVGERGANVTVNNNEPLRLAAAHGYLDVVKYLVDHGADISVYNYEPFGEAAAEGHLPVAEYLASLGSDISASNYVAIRDASEEGHLHVVKYLVESGVDIGQCGKRCVMNAVHSGYLHVVRYLIASGADMTGCGLEKVLRLKRLPRSRKQVLAALDILIVNKE